MSVTRAVVRRRVQEMLHDMNPSDPLVSSDDTYNEALERHPFNISGRVFLPPSTVVSTTLVAGTYEYTLSDVRLQGLVQVFLNSDGTEMIPLPWEEFNAMFRQDTAMPAASGIPRYYAAREVSSASINDTVIRFGPTPNAAGTAKVYYAPLQTMATSPAPAYVGMTDSSSIVFPEDLLMALVCACAADIAGSVTPDKLASHNLNPNAASQWGGQVSQLILGYNRRVRNLVPHDHITKRTRAAEMPARV